MITTLSPQSRIKVLDLPVAHPGSCIICGSVGGDSRKFIDFGKRVERIGVIYFCSECFTEVSIALGFLPVAEYDKLLKELKETQVNLAEFKLKHKDVTSALDTLFANYKPDDGAPGVPVPSVDVSDGDSAAPEGMPDRESETNEPTSSEGLDDIFDDSDFDE